MKFPKKLYVRVDTNSGEPIFIADADAGSLVDMYEKVKVASYELVEISEVKGVAITNFKMS